MIITKASGARLEFSLALAVVAVKVWKTTDRYITGSGGRATVILSQQSVGLEGGSWSRESNVILSARGFMLGW